MPKIAITVSLETDTNQIFENAAIAESLQRNSPLGEGADLAQTGKDIWARRLKEFAASDKKIVEHEKLRSLREAQDAAIVSAIAAAIDASALSIDIEP